MDARDKRGHDVEQNERGMVERGLNVFWILLGLAVMASSWSLGVIGPAGPDSGLFPLIAGLIIVAAAVALLLRPTELAPVWPRGAALGRIAGVVGGLALMTIAMPYLGFAVAGALTMLVLLRTVEQTSWLESIALALAATAAVVWLFGHMLGMVLPRGVLSLGLWGW